VQALDSIPNPASEGDAAGTSSATPITAAEFDLLGAFGARVLHSLVVFAGIGGVDGEEAEEALAAREGEEGEMSVLERQWRGVARDFFLQAMDGARQCHAHLLATYVAFRSLAVAKSAPALSGEQISVCVKRRRCGGVLLSAPISYCIAGVRGEHARRARV
jgi:hypothetical protein